MVAEDQLEVRPAQAADLLGLGLDLHLRLAHARAADRRVLLALDLDDAHPARPEARQLGLVAERRDLDAVVAADLQDRLALEALDDAAVDLDPDARRRLRALRRLGVEQALGQRHRSRSRDAVVGARDEVSHGSPYAERTDRHRDRVTDAGWAGAAKDVVVELGTEVSHPAREREGGQALVVAQGRGHDVGRQVGQERVVGGRGRPSTTRSAISTSRRVPMRHGMVLPHASLGAEPGQQPGQVDDAGPVVGDDDGPGTDVGAGGAERVEVVRRVQEIRREEPARRSADRAAALTDRPSRQRRRRASTMSRSGVPSGTSAMPVAGRASGPGRGPCPGCRPCRSPRTPRRRCGGSTARRARVWTLLTTVGMPNRPRSAGCGGRCSGWPRLPSRAFSRTVSSPSM